MTCKPAAVAAEPNPAFRKCWIEGLNFTHDNKGLEDIVYLGAGRALALCEGNECAGGARGRAPGHGRLVAHRVLVRDFSSWPGVEGCLRVTVGTRAENDAFLAALGSVVRESGVR